MTTATETSTEPDLQTLADRYREVRQASERLCAPLETEDQVVQSMDDASPTRWHLAHTTWFFETLVLQPASPGYRSINPTFQYLFNSYYNSLGDQFPRPQRGLLTRPTVAEVMAYREHVDRAMLALLETATAQDLPQDVITLGMHHEQQHQELMVTDLKHLLSLNPMYPCYRATETAQVVEVPTLGWVDRPEGLVEIGHAGDGFAYDNELPRHRTFVEAFALGDRLITCGEYQQFIDDGGYQTADLWLADGWSVVQQEGWNTPLYWLELDGGWETFTLAGLRDLNPSEPVCHVSYYEADAFARWAGARLATEAEWELVARDARIDGNFADSERFHPAPISRQPNDSAAQMFGDVWEWTQSPYTPYPGYRPPAGALGEYNSKFMSSQMVLRGGSCATPASHIRATYRNFFAPSKRWQFTGIRLAR